MAIISCKRKNGSLYVSFGADTSIRFAARIKSALSRIISEPVQNYNLDLSEVVDTDVTFIQLLIAFNEMLKKQSRTMVLINLPAESQFRLTAAECGIEIKNLFDIKDG